MAGSKTKSKSYPQFPSELKQQLPPKEALELMPRDLIEEFGAFVFAKDEDGVKIAARDPNDKFLRRFIDERFGERVVWHIAQEEDLAFLLDNLARNFSEEIGRLADGSAGTNGNIVSLVDRIFRFSFSKAASDIHIEPTREVSVVRFRIDGVLHTLLRLPSDIHNALVSRIKILGNLKIDEYRRPQDGRIELVEFPDLTLRISTVPTLYGEKVAIRVLDDSHKDFSLRSLGFSEAQEAILVRNIEKPFGMIVTSGPTGSGKTTTLYGLLHMVPKEEVNISTLEDPVEYALAGVNQIQVDPRAQLTFASGLRSLLRQDPDVMMVGEIRDSETAIMAAEAALTGHLVLTTLHTNDAPSVFTRLLEMKVEDFTVASTMNVVVAQRLVRKLCQACSKNEKLGSAILQKIKERPDILATLEAMGSGISSLADKEFKTPVGCDMCLQSGYRGRVGLFEVLEMSKTVHDLVLQHASADRIRDAALQSGFRDILADGIDKALAGTTSFAEVLRATRNS